MNTMPLVRGTLSSLDISATSTGVKRLSRTLFLIAAYYQGDRPKTFNYVELSSVSGHLLPTETPEYQTNIPSPVP